MIVALQTLIFFREAIFTAIDRFIRPYFKILTLQFKDDDLSDDDSDDHVFADYDDERGVVFYPPVYVQRYAAVIDCLMDERWYGKLKKVVDFGYNDMSFIKYLKDVPGVAHILGVDLEILSLRCPSDLFKCSKQFIPKKETPLEVTLFQGNAADPDYRLIGTDAVVAIEMIEHMLPHDLERFVHTVFGFIKPRVAVITTPNGDFNVLFKALEKNGLRRLDHFFEWSREQFNDWCSNIVLRYPQYTVICKGIGPGPAGTQHLGCCSQLALFVAKEYRKQPDLNLNSLALLTKQPSPASLANIDSWESPDTIGDNNMLCIENSVESYTELVLKQQSFMTIILTSPSFSLDTMEYKDKMSQCNMDFEFGKNFLMFDDEMYYNILIPRRNRVNRVYMIEDVANRLNCSTLQVKKFSKATQNLLAKNKMDPYTREVVDEIRYLTKILNFNKDTKNNLQNGHIWYNINWGENAPYWNQYYRIEREFSYPFQVKSEDSRIMDAISEEINGIADNEYDKFSMEKHTLEIPIDRLMEVVDHITIDVDRVKELLEWNGYDIVGDKLVYSPLALDHMSDPQDEWQDTDTVSDWDTTDLRSTALSDGSPIAPDLYGRYLHRVLDKKIRRIRSITDENIVTELDRIVCRLMKLALHTSKGQQNPPPMSWMLQKLFDLLSLTEKAIERRRRHYFENYGLKAIEYCKEDEIKEIVNVTKETGDASEDIMAKYHHFISPPDLIDSQDFHDDKILELEYDDSSSVTSKDIKDKEDDNVVIQDLFPLVFNYDQMHNLDIEDDKKIDVNTESMALNDQTNRNHVATGPKEITETNKCYLPSENYIQKTKNKSKQSMPTSRMKCKHSKHSKKTTGKRSMKNFVKIKTTVSVESASKIKKKIIGHNKQQSKLSKPIPDSLINLFKVDHNTDEFEEFRKIMPNGEIKNDTNNILNNISTPENCLFISIVTENGEESIPLRRNIGTDPEVNCDIDVDTISETVINITKDESFNCQQSVSAENVQSETIFIYDIYEPSTSKGIRNITTDVQCGPDISLTCALSPVLSLTRTPKLIFNGIKIEDSCHNIPATKKTCDFGMSTDCNNSVAVPKSIGIKIRESDVNFEDENDFAIAKSPENVSAGKDLTMETKLLKRMSPKDSDSEFYGSVGSLQKSIVDSSSKNTSGSQIQCETNNSVTKGFLRKNRSRKLVCGGIYVYSLKDKMVSEDVVYQGEWQRASKSIAKKQSSELVKRRKNIITKKKQISKTDTQKANENKRFPQRSPPVSLKRNSNVNKELKNMDQKKKTFEKLQNTRANKNMTRVVSKINIRTHRSKSIKPFDTKKLSQYKTITKNEDEICKRNIKNYLPLYLRRKIKKLNNEKYNSTKVITAIDKITKNNVFESNPDEIAKDLLKAPDNMHNNIDYIIFQNGVEIEHNTANNLTLPAEPANAVIKTSCSPQSQNSSTCSSPNSVATVRAIKMGQPRILSYQKNTLSKESHSGLKSQNNSSIYKNSKCSRVNKKLPLVCSNKENVPQSSKNISSNGGKSISKSNKNVTSKSKILFMAHTNESSIQTSTKKNSKRTPFKSPKPLNIKNNNEKNQKTTDLTNSNIILSKQNSDNFENESLNTSISYHANDSTDELKSYDSLSLNNNSEINNESYKVGNDSSNTPKQSVHETTSSIMSVIRRLLEDKLQVTDSNSKDSLISNYGTVILNRDELNKSFDSSFSPISIKTVVTNEDICTSESEVESSFGKEKESLVSFPSVKASVKEIDSVSFMSVASTSNSKFSDYYLAVNELDNTLPQSGHPLEESSVQDIFERKDQNKHFNVNGILEAFSGFSVNAEPFVGDNINLIDSETGSIALNSARLTVSEELFVSGRSSDTYESCYFDDDTYVPSWLFSVISQQQSIEESETINEPLEETMFDVNGNEIEPGVGMTSGAGDGKGIHSDNSQDSSGRGTSLSSTASSGPENEAILVDLSAATAYQPLIITAININEEPNSTHTNEVPSGNNECARSLLNPIQITSDVDADVSSLDTDAIDSDT